ncbi:transposase, partial [Paenibacillus polymyxa]|nr:transposase [Paenibacillus polymyxa]
FTDSQIIEAIKRVEAGLAVPELCRDLGISSATFYKWRSKYGGMDVSLMARMKELEAENARLRKMYIEEKLKAELDTRRCCTTCFAISRRRDGFRTFFAAPPRQS